MSGICGIGSIVIGEYLGIGIGGNFNIGTALVLHTWILYFEVLSMAKIYLFAFHFYHQLYKKIAHQPAHSKNALLPSSLLKYLQNGSNVILSNKHRYTLSDVWKSSIRSIIDTTVRLRETEREVPDT